jgi:hypothetical protein
MKSPRWLGACLCVCARLSVRVPILTMNYLTDFQDISYRHYVITGHPKFVLFYFIQSAI